jgi:hypothetical protein
MRLVKVIGGRLDGHVDRRGLAIDQRLGVESFGGMVFEPCFAQTASALGLDDAIPFGVQLHVITNATTERTGGIFYDR